MTWAEFVEAAFLRECRKTHQVPTPELRTYLDQSREGSGLPAPLADTVIRRFDWADNVPVGYRPDDNPDSPVRIRPDVWFGKPSIKGVSTEVIAEQHDAGETAETIAKLYALAPTDVAWALSFESSLRTRRIDRTINPKRAETFSQTRKEWSTPCTRRTIRT